MELHFSPASEQDTDTVFGFCKDLIDRYEDLATIDYDRVLNWVRRKLDANIREYTCVRLDGVKAGYFHFCPGEGCMELDDLYIFPEFRDRGIGTRIIEKCCAETALPVMLYVFVRNTGAIALYQRLGFQITQTVGNSRYIMVRSKHHQEAL